MTRQEANRKLVERIKIAVEACPDWRFMQLLMNLDIVTSDFDFDTNTHVFKDPWNEALTATLSRSEKREEARKR